MGQWASQLARQQREPYPTPAQRVQNVGEWQKERKKSFREVMRECYYKRDQARIEADEQGRQLKLLRQLEHQRLFGYVITIDGRTLTTEDALRQMEKHKLGKDEVLEWHNPEIYEDVVNSIGERDSLNDFPAMDINRGDVLHDPKIRDYVHPSLKDMP